MAGRANLPHNWVVSPIVAAVPHAFHRLPLWAMHETRRGTRMHCGALHCRVAL